MPVICPTVLAADKQQYDEQVNKIAHLGHRIQIDLTDSEFAPTATIGPDEVWWPAGFKADIHLMYKQPTAAIHQLVEHRPHMFIVHAESDGVFDEVAALARQQTIKIGLALLPQTPVDLIAGVLAEIDHVLIFSGDLGSFGGHADLSLLTKVAQLKAARPDLEVGWDGGVNLMNVAQLVTGGVDVLNVGGYIQKADDPHKAYNDLVRIAEETGTT
jgi:ribulose-phosphate 3-epimerase